MLSFEVVHDPWLRVHKVRGLSKLGGMDQTMWARTVVTGTCVLAPGRAPCKPCSSNLPQLASHRTRSRPVQLYDDVS